MGFKTRAMFNMCITLLSGCMWAQLHVVACIVHQRVKLHLSESKEAKGCQRVELHLSECWSSEIKAASK